MFYDYNMQTQKQYMRKAGSGYADMTKGVEETISIFSENVALNPMMPAGNNSANQFELPPDWFLLNRMYYYSHQLALH